MLLVEPMQKMRKRDRERTVGCKRTSTHQKIIIINNTAMSRKQNIKKSNIVLVKMLLKYTISQK